ncbi:MAG: helix-turn-helix domain-containing protein [Desulfovermiculus sp.]
MDYSELGAYLKEERERQGLSLEDVQQKTKISLSSLEAIEEGRINELPHPVYAKGFIKNYAHYLGLNAEELAGTFAQKAGIDEEFEDETEHLQHELTPARTRSKWTLISILISLVLLVVLGWLLYDLFWASPEPDTSSQGSKSSQSVQTQNGQGPGAKSQEQSAQADDNSSSQDEGWVDEEEVRDAESQLAENNASALGVIPEEGDLDVQQGSEELATSTSSQEQVQAQTNRENEANADAEQEQTSAGTDSGQSEEDSQVPDQGQRHALQIEASEACWMSAKIDAKQRDLYLRPGESVTFRFQDVLEIKLGNAGGVQLTFDGQKYPLDAASGEVLSLTFP